MAKLKSFTKQAKTKSKKEQKLESADDFQAAGVEFEEAAGKWRAGDAAKSMRFFRRAIDVYDQGLRKFPQSIDLAYNKARVQLEIATHPILVDELEQPQRAVLDEALASHRYTLQLDPENSDALFNASQVLTAIAELIATDEDEESGNEAEALKALREALELQGTCLGLQERKYQEFLELERFANEQNTSDKPATTAASKEASESGGGAEEDDEWFNVVEPVTSDTLIDTLLAQLGTLTTFCSILSSSPESAAPPNTLAWVEEISTGVINKIETISRDKHGGRLQEVALARANLVSAMLEAGYRSGKIDAETYGRELNSIFSKSEFEQSVEGLLAKARSLLALSSALGDSDNGDAESQSTLRWNVLTVSISSLKSASAIRGISQEDLVATHLLRGDASLYLYSMAFPPVSHQTAIKTSSQNAKNAEVYYRNASRLTSDEEERDVASLKSTIAQYLQGYSQGNTQGGDISGLLVQASPRGQEWVMKELEEMMSENLVPQALFL
ncbi:hypothetical protein Daesc_008032 [Daldinia eschscholtzii]|uniref:Uncharacterized protein n=1 Tax=Daldinia eschscholtzii TaxID=292717 RepID=A0AAX6MGE5_9PEZI